MVCHGSDHAQKAKVHSLPSHSPERSEKGSSIPLPPSAEEHVPSHFLNHVPAEHVTRPALPRRSPPHRRHTACSLQPAAVSLARWETKALFWPAGGTVSPLLHQEVLRFVGVRFIGRGCVNRRGSSVLSPPQNQVFFPYYNCFSHPLLFGTTFL